MTTPTQHQPRNILVTGGAGFIGSHLIERLLHEQPDATITVVDDLSTGHRANLARVQDRITFVEGDVVEILPLLDDAKPYSAVYHLAAAVGVKLVLTDPIRAIETNIAGTSAALRFAHEHGSAPTLIASSSEVYGKPNTAVFSEDDDSHFGPTTTTRWSYAHTKAIDEHLALAFHQTHQLPAVAVRFFNTVGPRQVGDYGMVLPAFVRAAREGTPLRVFGTGEQSRCFCDVRDVASVLPRLLEHPQAHGRVINVGADTPISILELAELARKTLDSASPIERIPYEDAYPAGFEDLHRRRPDLARLRSLTAFEPSISLEQTIRDIAQHQIQQSPGAYNSTEQTATPSNAPDANA